MRLAFEVFSFFFSLSVCVLLLAVDCRRRRRISRHRNDIVVVPIAGLISCFSTLFASRNRTMQSRLLFNLFIYL